MQSLTVKNDNRGCFCLCLLSYMTIISSVFSANPNLFVSAENSQFDNFMSGPQVIEVVVIDRDINETDELQSEPDVTVNGHILRMVQAVDGNWYGYFADRERVQIADNTVGLPGFGLDYGEFCRESSEIVGIDLSDTDGFAIPRNITSGSNGLDDLGMCDTTITESDPFINHVVREPKDVNTNPVVPRGQIGINVNAWPLIQLYDLNPTGNVVVQYNKGGGVQTTTLTFDTVQDFADLELDRSVYPRDSQVHFIITDLALNIDPTDEDSWTFGTNNAAPMVVYQAFNENGDIDADGTAGAVNIIDLLEDLMFDDNGILLIEPDAVHSGIDVINLFDTEDQQIISGDSAAEAVSAGGSFAPGSQPISVTEQGPNSGIFSSSDEGDQSGLRIKADALRGTTATIDYNDTPASILTGFFTAAIDIQPVDDEWNSGEEIPVVVRDNDLNKNSRADEDLDLFNPEVVSIPSLQTGNPFTLENLISARLAGTELVVDDVQVFSQRAMLRVASGDINIPDGSTLALTLSDTFADLYESIRNPSGSFSGFNFFNFDIRSFRQISRNIASIDITDGRRRTRLIESDYQSMINLDDATEDSVFAMDTIANVQVIFTFNVDGSEVVTDGTILPIVCDFFSFGKINDGIGTDERINNMIVRLELEETGDNTSLFAGSLEFTMLNQLNILDPNTYEGLSPIADDPTFIVPKGFLDGDAPQVNYFDIATDGSPTRRRDQEEAPSHTGSISFERESYRSGDTITVTFEDQDLNTDADLFDIYFRVDPADFPSDPARDTLGKPGLGNYTTRALGAFGRLFDITFNGERWTSGLTANGGVCGEAGIPDDGLTDSGFVLVETSRNSGVFVGSFRVPETFCNASTEMIESTLGTEVRVNYIDFATAVNTVVEFSAVAAITPPRTWFVNHAATGANSGLTWGDAFTNLQDALQVAGRGDEIWVAAGRYTPDVGGGNSPGDRFATFQLKSGVAMYGGFSGDETEPTQRDFETNITVLSGDLAGDDGPDFANNGENSFHVVTGNHTSASTVDGFTIRNGNAESTGASFGGGIFLRNCIARIENCNLEHNFAASSGAGIYAHRTSLAVQNCRFIENTARSGGGGIQNDSSSSEIIECVFIGNKALGGGGIRVVNSSSDTTIIGCKFIGNTGTFTGGGVEHHSGRLGMANCLFTGNSGDLGGGLFVGFQASVNNCTFFSNTAEFGGGVLMDAFLPSTISNCNFWGNTHDNPDDERAQIYVIDGRGSVSIRHNLIQDWPTPGTDGNIALDPLFIDADGPDNIVGTEDDDLRLRPDSPGIDAGNNEVDIDPNTDGVQPLPDVDLAGNTRFVDNPDTEDTGIGTPPIVDIGAYEFFLPPTIEFASATTVASDELDTLVELSVVLSIPNKAVLEEAVSIDVVDTTNGTALPGIDYEFTSPTIVNFPAGSGDGTSGTVSLAILQDTALEGVENVALRLDNIQGNAALGNHANHSVLIVDQDLDADLVGYWPFDEGSGCITQNIVNSRRGQLEPDCPVSNPVWTTGQVGSALRFDGDDDTVDLGMIENGDPLQLISGGTLTAWFKLDPGDRWQRIVDKSTSSSGVNGYSLVADPRDRSIWLSVNNNNYKSDSEVYEFGEWTHVGATIEETAYTIYINGVEVLGNFESGSAQLPPKVTTPMRIGSWNHATGREFHGLLDDLRVYSRVLSEEEIAEIEAEVNPSAALVAHYPFDEGSSCVAQDIREGNHGMLRPECPENGPAWSMGRIRGGLEFDGDDDYVDLGEIKVNHPLQLSQGGTIAGWLRLNPGDRWQRIVDKSTNHSGINGYSLIADPRDRSIWVSVNRANYKSDPEVYEFGEWIHVAVTIADTNYAIYVNGIEVIGGFQSGSAQLPPVVTTPMRIGTWNHSTGRELHGLLDDLRIYNRALDAKEIIGVKNEGNAETALIANYKMDEAAGCTTADAVDGDRSKLGILAPDCTSDSSDGPTWSVGRLNSGLDFDGDDDFVDFGDVEIDHPLQLAVGGTLAGWLRPEPGDRWQRIIDKSTNHSGINGYALIADPLDRSIWLSVNRTNYKSVAGVYEFSEWAHVAAVITEVTFSIYVNGIKVEGAFETSGAQLPPAVAAPMRIGSWNHATGREFHGLLDDLRIYGRALDAGEIAEIHEQASANNALVAHYNFGEGTGCTTADIVAGAENKLGSLEPNCIAGSSDAPQWSVGKVNTGLDFDGDDDFVDLGSIEVGHPLQLSGGGTLTAWFRPQAGDRWQRIIDKSTNHSGINGYALIADPFDRSIWLSVNQANYKTTGGVYEFGEWAHVAAVMSERGFTIYIDGLVVSGSFIAGSAQVPPDVAARMRIGTWNHSSGREFHGRLDELRIYNRALTVSEIEDFIVGSVFRSPPVVGSLSSKAIDSHPPLITENSSHFSVLSQTVYEDAEDGMIDGWQAYGDGAVINLGDEIGNRIISTTGEFPADSFRLGLSDDGNWNNTEEFTASFVILMEDDAAVYFRVDTTDGEKYLCYRPGFEEIEIDDSVICFGLGIEPDGNWHEVIRNLAEDLEYAIPGTKLISIKDFYIFGSAGLDNLILYKHIAE